jgi:hypothetical protein
VSLWSRQCQLPSTTGVSDWSRQCQLSSSTSVSLWPTHSGRPATIYYKCVLVAQTQWKASYHIVQVCPCAPTQWKASYHLLQVCPCGSDSASYDVLQVCPCGPDSASYHLLQVCIWGPDTVEGQLLSTTSVYMGSRHSGRPATIYYKCFLVAQTQWKVSYHLLQVCPCGQDTVEGQLPSTTSVSLWTRHSKTPYTIY